MNQTAILNRPTLKEALEEWKKILAERGFATDIIWIFQENLCIEKQRTEQGGFRFGFQTRFTPPSEDALEVAYDHFSETDAPIVFYRLGKSFDKSVCTLLCDRWFEHKSAAQGFLRRDDWKTSFHPGQKDDIEEISELARWVRRVRRDRTFHDLDFCMSLATIDEIKVYGRALAPYERFAEAMLKRLRRLLGRPA